MALQGSGLLPAAGVGAVALLGGPGPGRGGRRWPTGGQSPTTGGPVDGPGMPIQLGDLQQQVTAGDLAAGPHRQGRRADAVEAVEPPGQHQALDHRAGDVRAVPEVGERVVGPARHDALHLGLADPLHLRQRQPDAVGPAIGPSVGRGLAGDAAEHRGGWLVQETDRLDDVLLLRGVDVQAEDRDAALAGVVEDEPLGVHARVVGEHPGQEVRRPVRLEPGRLVGRQRERRRVGLAEAERGERLEDLPDPLDHGQGVAPAQRPGEEPHLRLRHPLQVAEGAPLLVGLGVGDAGEQRDHLDHLLVEDDHAMGLAEDGAQVVVEVRRRLPALLDVEVRGDHVALDRPRPEQRDVGDDVGEGVDTGLADQLALAR